MSRTGYRDERLEALGAMLEREGVLRLRDAAVRLGVSEMTVRRDITEARDRFTCLGGHIVGALDGLAGSDYVLDQEKDSHAAAKAAACARAVKLIEEDDTIFIDCGTTTPHLAARIPEDMRLTAICYSMNVAEILCHRKNIRLIVLGGLYHPAAASFSGEEGLETLKRLNLNKAFISAGGVHETRGVTCSHFHEVPIKQTAIERALECHLVVDASKFGKVRPAHFAEIGAFTSIISDQPQPV
ncbi:DeoR/GlpR family DNA-binding transcription regulator [Pseudaminobacter soli (ex Li et al. 2025)]|uniref:DeoR family transcriptional regulator n=1 Tax=Pseudaminobacter soli (ex Li et al. 2025) TaxID=1295366 RepID=A0A2P7S5T6_9HYPH|nr:DeoR/GlpR family DNA-binding transcription regulator [Mesorhizobium soli]PSJ57832.1 DeoR family transcriptional regulator [Mesorhizobium soli]